MGVERDKERGGVQRRKWRKREKRKLIHSHIFVFSVTINACSHVTVT